MRMRTLAFATVTGLPLAERAPSKWLRPNPRPPPIPSPSRSRPKPPRRRHWQDTP
jgi:hypothetical protein